MSHVRTLGPKRYQARWSGLDGRPKSKVFAKKSDAERHLVGVRHAMLTGSYVDPASGKVTVGEVAEQWLAGKVNLKATSRARARSLLDVHVRPRWEHVPVSGVEHSAVQAWVATLGKTHSGATVKKIHNVLSGVLDVAVKDRRLVANPCRAINLPRPAVKARTYLTPEQVFALADAAAKPTGKSRGARTDAIFAQNRLIVLTLAYCGLRWGEMAALRVSSLDMLRRRVAVTASVSTVDGEGLVWTTPKDHEHRSVPMPNFLIEELAQHVEGKKPGDLLFPAHDGQPLSHRIERRAWFRAAADAAGVSNLTPHDLRHAAASLAVSAGANVKAVQRMLGHAQASMTLDTYADLFDSDLDAVAERLDAIAKPLLATGSESSMNLAEVIDLAGVS